MENKGFLYTALWFLSIALLLIGIAIMSIGKLYIGGLFIGISILILLSLPEDGLREKYADILKKFEGDRD